MNINLVTKDDLLEFKTELLAAIKQAIENKVPIKYKWIKSYEVRNMLGVSPGTLQNMRVNGTIQYTKIGGLVFYQYEDVIKLMEGNKKNVPKK